MFTSKHLLRTISLLSVTVNLLTLPMAWNEKEMGWQEYIQRNRPPTVDEKGCLDFRYLKSDDHSADQIRLTSVDFSYLSEEEKKRVTRLDLRYNHLKVLPPEIETFEELQELDVSDNELESLPDIVGTLRKLVFLSVARNKLKELPSAIGKLKKLRELNLFGNQLRTLPAELGNLPLQALNMLKNPISSLPPALLKIVKAFWLFHPSEIEKFTKRHPDPSISISLHSE